MTTAATIRIVPADTPELIPTVRELFREYQQQLGVDLCFQGFEAELAALPGKYARPQGQLLLAWTDDQIAGCVALRPIDEERCEMKRLYVRAASRKLGLGRLLVETICDEARRAGYKRIYLDTLPTMAAARGLYTDMGFELTEAYVHNPIAGTDFLMLQL